MKLMEFFEDDSGRLSAMRLYCFVALVMAAVLSLRQPVDFGLVVTWLTAAFAPKAIQKPVELMKAKSKQ